MSKLLGAHPARRWNRARPVSVLAVAAVLGACAQGGLNTDITTLAKPEENSARADMASASPITTGSLPATPRPSAEQRTGEPAVKSTATGPIADARRLRQAGDKAKAMEVLDRAAEKDGKDIALARERGMLALELGQVDKARTLLKKAVDQAPTDWRTHSAYGSALSASGKQQDAQMQFAKALELAPDQPAVLNNLALSYALDGKHDQAEALLRRVALGKEADARSRQNLALLLGLRGQHEEAQKVSAAVLPKDKAQANTRMLQGAPEPAAPASAEPSKAPVASRQGSESLKAAAASGIDQPTYRLGGPRD